MACLPTFPNHALREKLSRFLRFTLWKKVGKKTYRFLGDEPIHFCGIDPYLRDFHTWYMILLNVYRLILSSNMLESIAKYQN